MRSSTADIHSPAGKWPARGSRKNQSNSCGLEARASAGVSPVHIPASTSVTSGTTSAATPAWEAMGSAVMRARARGLVYHDAYPGGSQLPRGVHCLGQADPIE
jgi:hypothetical protein